MNHNVVITAQVQHFVAITKMPITTLLRTHDKNKPQTIVYLQQRYILRSKVTEQVSGPLDIEQ